jgi:hypothetical protein
MQALADPRGLAIDERPLERRVRDGGGEQEQVLAAHAAGNVTPGHHDPLPSSRTWHHRVEGDRLGGPWPVTAIRAACRRVALPAIDLGPGTGNDNAWIRIAFPAGGLRHMTGGRHV